MLRAKVGAAWIQTYSGIAFPVLAPEVGHISILDIAHALSQVCRFAGHSQVFYSVAQHSVLVSHAVPECCALQGLLHDAPEAYLGDVTRPLKHSGAMSGYLKAEERLWRVIARRFRVPERLAAAVELADKRMLSTEQRDLMGAPPREWGSSAEPLAEPISPLGSEAARQLFLARFLELGGMA